MGRFSRGDKPPTPDGPSGRSLRALIVEDEAIVAAALADMLEDIGAEPVAAVRNGYAAIALAEHYRPDVVLMDVALHGDMDGIEAARVIRERFQIPIVFVTGNDNPLTELRVAEIGGGEVLAKLLDSREIGLALRRACQQKH